MNFWAMNALMIGVTMAYAVQALIYGTAGKWPHAIMLAGYSAANIGMIWSTR